MSLLITYWRHRRRALSHRRHSLLRTADTDFSGGIWYYSPQRRSHEGAGAFQNLMTNTSRDTSSFTDFPIPQDYPQYMSHREFLKYLKAYADHFNLRPHIRFNSRVVHVAPADDYQRTGEWLVTVECEGRRETQLFQSVMVCRGMLTDPLYPDLPGEFEGEIMHMADYRSPEVFTDKRVLVIGKYVIIYSRGGAEDWSLWLILPHVVSIEDQYITYILTKS